MSIVTRLVLPVPVVLINVARLVILILSSITINVFQSVLKVIMVILILIAVKNVLMNVELV